MAMESSNGMSQVTENNSQPVLTSSAPQQAPQETAKAPDERKFTQSDVNEIVKRAKHSAVEDFRRLQSEQPQYAQQKYGENVQNQQPSTQSQPFNDDHYRKLVNEEILRNRDQWMQEARAKAEAEQVQGIVQNFQNKFSTGKEKYQDFDQIVGKPENFARFPNMVQILTQHVDNAEDVLYEISKNKGKLVNLEMMARDYFDEAVSEAKRISQSLKDNEAAAKVKVPNAPLSQMRPSNTGTGSGGWSVADARRKYKA